LKIERRDIDNDRDNIEKEGGEGEDRESFAKKTHNLPLKLS
jgi:hypothetical protein